MNILFVILTYKRPKILNHCITSLFNNTNIKPTESWIIDDCSNEELKKQLFMFATKRTDLNINCSFKSKNFGVAYSFEEAFNIARMRNPDIFCLIESDYIWRKGWLEDVIAVYKANPYVIGIPGTSHPDMYDRVKTHGEFIRLMENQFGRDIYYRDYTYKPFDLQTERGTIKVQGVTNSCGCSIFFWKRMMDLFSENELDKDYWFWMERAFHKRENLDRKTASDAHMSGTPTFLWEQCMISKNIDFTKNFAWLDICDYSIGNHICGGADSINGKIVDEGVTFINSPVWKNEYMVQDPRKIEI